MRKNLTGKKNTRYETKSLWNVFCFPISVIFYTYSFLLGRVTDSVPYYYFKFYDYTIHRLCAAIILVNACFLVVVKTECFTQSFEKINEK